MSHLLNTVKNDELLNDGNESLLHKLFHQENIRLFKPTSLKFKCTCSLNRSANAILSLGQTDARVLLKELGVISIDCQFCFATYEFSEDDITRLYEGAVH